MSGFMTCDDGRRRLRARAEAARRRLSPGMPGASALDAQIASMQRRLDETAVLLGRTHETEAHSALVSEIGDTRRRLGIALFARDRKRRPEAYAR